mmetsp:Transcript_12606/g.27352  ORF Transcript_12606/g.27352 Transcript_12606/m.27352 type:complete len:1624 (-) Transcript_12606:148-5019(-)|eukprot:CAMPEP_0172306008 /NCGR_PEP_ID=MMETSP1058-20130122/7180_1 /TAXON_ID=83371 /ORGANISM="Detonula confervacea, Strain CCMP 353" /LENGTH=1623 /DNA_ID=CAMNT_0013017779 /DNA_START=281 /DNA_END=5152 /DNA_ORIENTATION=+
MEAGTQVWSYEASGDDPWILSKVIDRTADAIQLKHLSGEDGDSFSRPLLPSSSGEEGAKYEGIELANAPLSEADAAEGADNDMIALQHLHEPAILHAVSERYFRGEIYTWTGPVLIAVNPFQRLPLYTREILESYRQEGLLRSQGLSDSNTKELGPHVYSIADRSYRQMMSEQRKSQSILISGESGAGKTETTKIVMLYLTTLGSANNEEGPAVEVGVEEIADGGGKKLSIMERVLQSNPILEAFGNAKTLRNDNSSRFGKFIELGFNRAGILQGAKVQTYLLEKVRIGYHGSGERNYHIFYQLLRGATEEQHHKYCFHDGLTGGLELANYFHLTGQGGAPQLREFSDEEGLKYTLKSMRSMGWQEDKIDHVLSIIAGILHLGQVKFESKMSDGGQEIASIADEKTVADAAKLLGVDLDKLITALTVRIMVTRGDEIRIDLDPTKASEARDSLAKTVFGAMFLWVVKQVNDCIMWEDDKDIRSSAGVLDIFGFESFATNSFEQLCINFTNEALQQQFNKFIFKLEQEEYERENINWAFIEFPDNQDCLDTITARPKGILAMLDDECKLGQRGSDKNWAKRLNDTYLPEKNQTISDNTRYSATKMQQAKFIFCVRHFAGNVEYTAETNFLEKNRDEIPLTAKSLFEQDCTDLIKEIYAIQKDQSEEKESDKDKGKPAKQKTVSQQFKLQLNSLIEMVEKTDPHYIRCLKPNDAAKPKLMTRKRLTEQLRYGGVLEAVRVARMGYPVRLDHTGFFKRYRMLLPSVPDDVFPWSMDDSNQEPQTLCVKFLDLLLEDGAKPVNYATEDGSMSRVNKIRMGQRQPEPMDFPKTDVQLGLSKVFMRKGPHDKLESHRVFHQNASIILIQSWMRGLQQERRYLVQEDAALTIERWYRGCIGRACWWKLREAQASLLLTNTFRMQINRRKYNRARSGTVRLQAQFRGRTVRKVNAATKIQSFHRMHVRNSAYRKLKSATIALQCCVRRGAAKAVFDEIKRAQKDMGKVKEHNEKLKMEMASLKAMLQAQGASAVGKAENAKAIAEKQKEIDRLEARIAELEMELEKEKENVKKLETVLDAQKGNNQRLTQDLQYQKEIVSRGSSSPVPLSRKHSRGASLNVPVQVENVVDAVVVGHTITPEALAMHRAEVARLGEQLEEERRLGRAARIEVRHLRAAIADKGDLDVTASTELISDNVSEMSGSEMDRSDVPIISELESTGPPAPKTPERDTISRALNDPPADTREKMDVNMRSVSDYFPMIKRGFIGEEKEEGAAEVVAVGWKHDVTSRKEREEGLRDEVRVFESKVKRFYPLLEEGIDVTVWQLNKSAEVGVDGPGGEEFAVKSSSMTLKLHRRGDLLVQTVLTFNSTGGYLSKALGRRRDKAAHEPLPLNDILEVKAGCVGFDHAELPSSSTKKGKSSKVKSENMQSSLFMTIKATPTPMASSRFYFLRLKSRSTRNDLLSGLRGILADLQVHEGVSISQIQTPAAAQQARRMPGSAHKNAGPNPFMGKRGDIMVPLTEVHDLINRERESYDRLLLTMLQGSTDLKEKEDELLTLRGKLHQSMAECAEKDKTQANDSKLIMQLSKKLETLLMENEDLRDSNDRLNQRLVQVECDKIQTQTLIENKKSFV